MHESHVLRSYRCETTLKVKRVAGRDYIIELIACVYGGVFVSFALMYWHFVVFLQDKTSKRRDDLDDSLQAQQYFADANESESWMREKEPVVGNTDYGKDEDSAEVKIEKKQYVIISLCFSFVFKFFF